MPSADLRSRSAALRGEKDDCWSMEAIQALAETLQISNGEAIELIMREEANVPDYA